MTMTKYRPIKCERCGKYIPLSAFMAGKTLTRYNYDREETEHLCPSCAICPACLIPADEAAKICERKYPVVFGRPNGCFYKP